MIGSMDLSCAFVNEGFCRQKAKFNENTHPFERFVTDYIHFLAAMRTSSLHVISLMFS